MTVNIELPPAIERRLRLSIENLDEVAKEAALVEFYRRGQLTHHELATALGLARLEIDAVLKRHKVTEDLISPAEFERQVLALRSLVGE